MGTFISCITNTDACSYPTAAGQFQWVAECAPPRFRRILSFCTGSLCVLAWPTFFASCCVIIGNTVKDCVLIYHPTSPVIGHPIAPGWFTTLVAWVALYFAYVFNTIWAKRLAWFEKAMLVVHVCLFFAVAVVLLTMSPRAQAKDVLLTFNNGGDVSLHTIPSEETNGLMLTNNDSGRA
jgi:choline transport protein